MLHCCRHPHYYIIYWQVTPHDEDVSQKYSLDFSVVFSHWWPSSIKTKTLTLQKIIRKSAPGSAAAQSFPTTIHSATEPRDSLGLLTTKAWLELIKHGVVCYLFINSLFDVSQCAMRVVVELIEDFASEQPCSFLHAITIRPIWPCEDAPFCSHGRVGVLQERLFTLSFNINHSYWEMLPHVHKTPQLFLWWATLCYLHVFACALPVWLSMWVFLH